MFNDSKFGRSAVAPLILIFLSNMLFAATSCPAHSAIDQVPFFVGQTYFDILHRAPDGASHKPRVSQLEQQNSSLCGASNPAISSGACEWNNNVQLAMELLISPESLSKNGSMDSNPAFVTALYQLILKRSPDSDGFQYNLSALNAGGSRSGAVARVLLSAEYRRRFACTDSATSNPSCRGGESVDPAPAFVDQLEKDVLGQSSNADRSASLDYLTSNELAMCANPSATAYTLCDYIVEAQTVMNVLTGPASQKSNPPLADDSAFVSALYRHLLQRAPDPAGLESHTNLLKETHDRLGTVYSFLASEEYRNRFGCYAGVRDHLNMGINGHPLTQAVYSDSVGVSYDEQLTKVQEAGSRWYRFDVGATTTDASFPKMDSLVAKAKAHAVQLLPVLMPPVDLAREDAHTIYQTSYAGAVNVVSRYKSSIHVWELGNEEDIYSMHIAGDPGWSSGTPSGEHATDYNPQKFAAVAAMLRGLADGVRAADGTALRIIDFAGWLHTGFLQRLEDDKVPYDIVGIHWYQNYGEITCPGQALPCPPAPQHFNVVQRLQSITNSKPLWMTETNYSPSPNDSPDMDLARRQKYLAPVLQTYLHHPAIYPFQTVMVYELLDEPNLPSGVTQTKVGLFTVTPKEAGKFSLGTAKPEYSDASVLFKR